MKAALLVVSSVIVLGALLMPGTTSGFVSTIDNSTNSVSLANYFKCADADVAPDVVGSPPLFVWPLTETAGPTAGDISGRGNSGTYSGTVGSDSAAPRACSRDTNASAYQLDGTSSFVYLGTQQPAPGPTTFSLSVWFKTTAAQGRLFGFASSPNGASSTYDRVVYLDTQGYLRFGIYNRDYSTSCGSMNCTVKSKVTYNDGRWHHVVATLGDAGATYSGMRLYVDGRTVASAAQFVTPENAAGYWRVGFGNLAGWPDSATPYYFMGSMRYAAVYTTVLSPDQIAQLYASGA